MPLSPVPWKPAAPLAPAGWLTESWPDRGVELAGDSEGITETKKQEIPLANSELRPPCSERALATLISVGPVRCRDKECWAHAISRSETCKGEGEVPLPLSTTESQTREHRLGVVEKCKVPAGHLCTGCMVVMFTKEKGGEYDGGEEEAAEGGGQWRAVVRGRETTWIWEPLEKKGEVTTKLEVTKNQVTLATVDSVTWWELKDV